MRGLDHPFFLPLWRRVALVVFCLGWALAELSRGFGAWALIFAVAGLYCAWALLIAYDAEEVRKNGGSGGA